MTEPFYLHVVHNDKELRFPAQLFRLGANHQIKVSIHGTDVLFERGEERSYRPLAGQSPLLMNAIDQSLLDSITTAMAKTGETA
jgi:hypothetical protein